MPDEKLKQAMLYLAERHDGDGRFGKTRLFKELFWADALHYAMTGETITGSEYIKYPQGPAPRRGMRVFDQILAENAGVEVEIPTPSGVRKKLRANVEPDLSLFSPEELDQIDAIAKFFEGVSAKDASDHSHDHSPWRYAADNGLISLDMIFIDTDRRPTEESKLAALTGILDAGAIAV